MSEVGELEKLYWKYRKDIAYLFTEEKALNWTINDAKKDFPKSEVWERFMEEMFNKDGSYKADVWYDILDNKDVGEILDWIIEFMVVFKKWMGEKKKK